jgi:hypothetical protein
MDAKRSAVHAGKYFFATTLLAVVALGIIAYGATLAEPAIDTDSPAAFVDAVIPGLAVAAVGIALYRFGKSWALYKTLTSAHEEALADTFDTQRVKSDIVSVVDDRIADMQTEIQSVNREVRKLRDDDQFDFGGSDSGSQSTTGSSSGSPGPADSPSDSDPQP